MARPLMAKRLTKELTELRKPGGTPEGCVLLQADDLQTWTFSIEVLGESVYKGERFCLRFKFSNQCASRSQVLADAQCTLFALVASLIASVRLRVLGPADGCSQSTVLKSCSSSPTDGRHHCTVTSTGARALGARADRQQRAYLCADPAAQSDSTGASILGSGWSPVLVR